MLTRAVEEVCRREGGRVLAGLIRRFGDFSLAEDLLQDAYSKALECWPRDGLPANPAAWLTTVARNAGLDHVRRAARTLDDSSAVLDRLAQDAAPEDEHEHEHERGHGHGHGHGHGGAAPSQSCTVSAAGYSLAVDDDRLRLIFICCHPALAPGAQTALALRTLCGLSTREIARAYCETETATAQRLVRAKRKICLLYTSPSPRD